MAYKKKGGSKKVGFLGKVKRSASRFVKKRYGVGKKRSLNLGAIARDVASMATMLNAEKKILSIGAANGLAVGQPVGQVSQNATGARAFDLTPMMPQGTGVSDRTGNSIKLHSSYFQFQVQQQSSAVVTPLKIRIEMWSNPAKTQDESTILDDLYVTNPFTGIIDYNSARNPDHFNDYRKLLTRTCYLPVDSISGQLQTKQLAVPFKWNRGKGHHVRYTGTGSTNYLTDVQAGQVFLVYFCDVGNSSGTASGLNVPMQIPVTGAQIKMSYRHYYYDN